MLLRMKKAVFTLDSINLVAMEKNKNGCNFMCARRSENILFYLFIFFFFFAVNFTGSKDTEPYKTDVSCLCQYIINIYKPRKQVTNNII